MTSSVGQGGAKMNNQSWLVILYHRENRRDIGKILAVNGFRAWAARRIGDIEAAFIQGTQAKINKVGIAIITARNSTPWLKVQYEMVDEKGWI